MASTEYVNIIFKINSIRKLTSNLRDIRMDMLSGDASSFMSDLMRDAYISCQRESGMLKFYP